LGFRCLHVSTGRWKAKGKHLARVGSPWAEVSRDDKVGQP